MHTSKSIIFTSETCHKCYFTSEKCQLLDDVRFLHKFPCNSTFSTLVTSLFVNKKHQVCIFLVSTKGIIWNQYYWALQIFFCFVLFCFASLPHPVSVGGVMQDVNVK